MAPDEEIRRRERDFVQWLDTIKNDAAAIFLLGDIFDFWFEYKYVVPRGFVRLLGKFAELTDNGIPIHFFAGNHDQWMRDYLSCEMNIQIYRKPTELNLNGKLFFIGHGHDISPKNLTNRILHFFFTNRLFRKLYASLHPYWGISFGKNWSNSHRKCRNRRKVISQPFKIENELIYQYAKKMLEGGKHYDFFVFGHRHFAVNIPLNENSRYINTGEWFENRTYAVFDGKEVTLHHVKMENFQGK